MTIRFEDFSGGLVVGIGVGLGYIVSAGLLKFIGSVLLRFLFLRRGDRAGRRR